MAGPPGILQIGDPRELARGAAFDFPGKTALERTNIVYLGLRDIRLVVKAGDTPDKIPPRGTAAELPSNGYDSRPRDGCSALATEATPIPPAQW